MSLTIDKEVRKPVPRIAYPGLKGLPVVETAVSEVLGDTGVLHYRGIRIEELVSDYTFEQVWSWLWDARIESADVAALTDSVLRSAAVDRTLAEAVALGSHSDEAEPWGAASSRLRSAISMASAFRGMRPLLDTSAAERRADALTICAQAPQLAALAAGYGASDGSVPRRSTATPTGEAANEAGDGASDEAEWGFAGRYLRSVRASTPTAEEARAIDRYLICVADHGLNASTFAARVIASTGSDLGSALTGAVGALMGPLHGGAPRRSLDLIERVGEARRARHVVRAELEAGRRLMGFGHAVYRTNDPRAQILRSIAVELGGPRIEVALAVEAAALEELDRRFPARPLRTNVEFWAAMVMDRCGIPPRMFTPTFAIARLVGWCAHIEEQVATGVLFRPSAAFLGPAHGGE